MGGGHEQASFPCRHEAPHVHAAGPRCKAFEPSEPLEDFVGRIAALTHSVSMGVKSTSLCKKVAPKYRILLHLLLSREGLDQAQKQVQPDPA